MSHNTRIRANLAAWAIGTTLTPAELDALDQLVFESINGDDGGQWNPSTPIGIGGAGLAVSGPLLASGVFAVPLAAQNFLQKSPSDFAQPIRAMFHNGTHYVAVGGPVSASGSIDYHVTRSLDGVNWTTVVIPPPGDAEGEAYCIDGTAGLMVIGIEASTSDTMNTLWSSDGGATWTEDNAGTDTGVSSTIWGIKYFAPASIWIAGGDGDLYTNTTGNIIAGTSWTSRTVAAGLNNRQLDLIAYRVASPLCVIATTEAAEADVMTSPDGVTWTGRTLAASMSARGLIYSEYWGKWFIVGTGGAMQYSTDGTTWTADNFIAANDLLGIAAIGPLLMILVGPAATAKTIWSLDGGANWYEGSRLVLGTSPKLTAIDGRFMIFDETRSYPGLRVGGVAESIGYV
jgi:hypothetical protein